MATYLRQMVLMEKGSVVKARVRERDLIIPALQAAASRPNGVITTSKLIEYMENEFDPVGKDAEVIEGRQDTYFSQKVRNLVSHRDVATSMFSQGLAIYDKQRESIQITESGRAWLESKS